MPSSLTAKRLREVLRYDPESGHFVRVASTPKKPAGALMGFDDGCGYLRTDIDGERHRLHRLAFLWMLGRWPEHFVDHQNGNRGDNSWANLREATNAVNGQNIRRASSNNKVGVLGVMRSRNGNFVAQLGVKGRSTHLGTFATAEAAHAAYVAAKRLHHEGNTL